MPKRIIDGEKTWRSKKLRQVQPESYRAEYLWMFALSNDVATFECDPEAIWATCYATTRPSITQEDVVKILDEFERVKLLFRWQVNDQVWGYWTGTDKPGLLPKPSEQYSKGKVPEPDPIELTAFLGRPMNEWGPGWNWKGYTNAGEARPASGQPAGDPPIGFGFGSGFGLGSGIGIGKETVAGGSGGLHSIPLQTQTQNRFGIHDNPMLTTVALLQHMQFMTGEIVAANDPVVPFLTEMAEEQLNLHRSQPLTIYNCRTKTERVVQPGDQHYPGPDGGCLEEDDQPGLSLRESSTVLAFSTYVFACKIITGLRQYFGVEDCEESLRVVFKMLGWPKQDFDVTVPEIHAVAHWAFKKSNYWPGELKNLADFCSRFPTIHEQYEKFYAKLPADKKPHMLGVGRPQPQDDEEDQ